MLNKKTILGLVLSQIVLIFSGSAARASDFQSPRTAALGGAGHASPLLTDSIYMNPSFTSLTQLRSFSLDYLTYNSGQIDNPYYGHNLNISVLDGSADSLFQAGVGYTRRDDVSMIHVGASKQIAQRFSLGVGTKFLFPNNSNSRATDGSISFSVLFARWIQSSVIIDNLFNGAIDRGFYREYILGTKINVMDIILLYVDPHTFGNLPPDQPSFGYEVGAELPFFSDIFLRIGKFRNATVPYQAQRGDGYGLGLGWIAPRLSLDYSYSKVTGPLATYSHNFGFSIFF